jgi:hypothetical protein
MTSATCKEAIVNYCKLNRKRIDDMFSEPLPDVDFQPSTLEKYWKRMQKYKEENTIVRIFDCIPFDMQLRAYVITDSTDANIITLYVNGE